ncbi:MAG: LPS biosynthesis protein [Actinobacteria bacterium]|nr:LPS biosynthesis protein [Actinomycetota bacterium]
MDIDNNELEKKALDYFRKKNDKKGEQLQKEFLENVKRSGQDYCSCTIKCRYHGKCVDCVIIHRGHRDHLPNCFHDMVNDKINQLSCLTEHSFNANKERNS